MRRQTPIHRGLHALSLLTLLAVSASAEQVKLKLLSPGGMRKIGGYIPQRLALSSEKPDTVKKLPEDLASPLFGTLKFGAREGPASILIVLDEPEGKPSRVFVDANDNGDLTDDAAPTWKVEPVRGRNGSEYKMSSGFVNVTSKLAGEPAEMSVGLYRFDPRDPDREALKGSLFYFADYVREGDATLGDKTYKAILVDSFTTGDFRGKNEEKSGAALMIDVNADGKFDPRYESFDVKEAFNIGGQTYEISGLTAGGQAFNIVKSSKTVAERVPPLEITVGKPATPFKAKTTDGTAVDFPASYKGKLVMLDFWATWCGPCVQELPNLTAAYQKLHDRGFEVLGISLDQAGASQKLADFTKAKNMPWQQIYDGKYWEAELAQLYGVQGIPTAYLVDGDTGLVLAVDGLRGEELLPTLEAALTKKGK